MFFAAGPEESAFLFGRGVSVCETDVDELGEEEDDVDVDLELQVTVLLFLLSLLLLCLLWRMGWGVVNLLVS